MKKILFLHSSSELYGSDRSLLNLIKNLDNDKFQIKVILPDEGPLVNEIRKLEGVTVIIKEIAILRRKNLSVKGLYKYINDFFKSIIFLKKIIKENKIDIVYTNTSVVFPGGIIAKVLGKRSIWHIREIIDNKYERKIVSMIINIFSDTIIANSNATAKAINSKMKNIKVVYNAIESKHTIREGCTIQKNNENIVIGMAGRINRWKGQKLFVDMATVISQEINNVNFLIAGDVYKDETYILEDLQSYIKSNNMEKKIQLLGQVEDMNAFYNKLDIFILPSIQPEPFGLVVIEAMDKGIPVIATNHGGPIEIIEDGVDGYLVDYKNCKDMAKKAIELINDIDLRSRIGSEGRKKRNNTFNVKRYVEEIQNILNI